MKNWLNAYFAFTKREYNGLLVLMTILLLISTLPSIYLRYFIRRSSITPEEKSAIIKLILVSQETTDSYTNIYKAKAHGGKSVSTTLFPFDPNKISMAEWQKLGLSPKQAQSIINYRDKGGKFYKSADLQKMYTITPQKFQQLEPYIAIENDRLTERKNYPVQAIKKEAIIIEINSADTLQLDQIKGIGAAFARRIVAYRTKLGGFYKKEQLMEVFGLDSIKYNEIKDQIRLDLTNLQKIAINIAEFETLKTHPYLSYKQINAIIQYRKQHGKFNNVDDLKKVVILTPQNIQKLTPYLSF